MHSYVFSNVVAGSGAKLPANAPSGTVKFIQNTGANALKVYPESGSVIGLNSANVPVSIPSGKSACFTRFDGNQWSSMIGA